MKFLYLLASLFCLVASGAYAQDWPMILGNQQLTGDNDGVAPEVFTTRWVWSAESPIYRAIPAPDGVLVSTADRRISLVSSSGQTSWSRLLLSPVIRSPVIWRGYTWLLSGRSILCLDLDDGQTVWSREDNSATQLVTPVVAKGVLFHGSRKGIQARVATNGRPLWTNEAISAWGAALVILEDSLLVQHRTYRSPGSFLACLDADTGKTRWMQAIPHEANIFPPLVLGDRVLQAAHDTLAVFALKDGHPLAKIRFSAPLASHPTVMQDSLFLPLTDGRIVSLDSSSLVQRTAFGHHRSQGNALAASAGRLYLASDAGEILELSASNGQVMRSLALPSITTHVQPFLCGGLLFATGKQKLVCIGPTLDREPDETVIESPSRRTLVLLDAKTGEAIQGAVRLTWEGGHAGIRHLGVETDPQGVAIVPHVIPDASRLTIERAGYTFSTFEWPATTSRLIVRLNPIEKATPIILEDVHFDIDSAGLLPASLPILHSLARFLQTNPGLRIRIEGHTDSSGEAAANMALSLKRSLVIREYLIRQGIGAWRMQTEGLGASRPIAPNSTEDGRSKNRRTEIRILS